MLAQKMSKSKSMMIKARNKRSKLNQTKKSDKKTKAEKQNPQNKVDFIKKANE